MQERWAFAAKGHVWARRGIWGKTRSGHIHAGLIRRLPRFLLNTVFAAGTVVSALALVVPAVPGLMGLKVMVVISGSMEPHIAVGDAVVIEPVSEGPIDVGDVITFQGYGARHLTTHRVTKVVDVQGRTHFQTKGDTNDTPDPNLAPAEAVVGRVAFAIPKIGWLLNYGSTPRGRLVLLGVPTSILLVQQGIALVAHRRSRRREDLAPGGEGVPGAGEVGGSERRLSPLRLADTWAMGPVRRRGRRFLAFVPARKGAVAAVLLVLVAGALAALVSPEAMNPGRTGALYTDAASVGDNTFSTGTW